MVNDLFFTHMNALPDHFSVTHIVLGMNIIIAGVELAFENIGTIIGVDIPPPLGDPAIRVSISYDNTNSAFRHVAKLEISECVTRSRCDEYTSKQNKSNCSARSFSKNDPTRFPHLS